METGEKIGSRVVSGSNSAIPACDLERDIRKFAARLNQAYASSIAQDAHTFKEKAMRLLRRERPPNEAVTRATKLRAQAQPWLAIYRQCIPDFGELSPGDRAVAMSRLRTAVRGRRHRRKQKPSKFVPEKIPA